MNKKLLIAALLAAYAIGLQAQKLSPNAQALLSRFDGKKSTMLKSFSDTTTTEVEAVKVFLDITDEAVLDSVRMFGGKIYTSFGDVFTAQIPVHALRDISRLQSVRYVEMGAPVHLCMDKARELSGIDAIHTNALNELPQAYDGTGVVVGIIDCGLDYGHIDFMTADGKDTRIKKVWDQNAYGKSPEKFGYGAEYTTFAEMKAAKTDDNQEYHGSHTTGIAAGGDKKSPYYGGAPGADIVFVSFGQNTADIPNAVQYIFDYAESVGKPCVINMSLGSHIGPHDGTSYLDKYLESVAGPGRILVGAVGNEGDSDMHVGKQFTSSDTSLKTLLQIPSATNKNTGVEIWGNAGSEFTVQIVITDAKGKIVEKSDPIPSSSTETLMKAFDNNVDCYFKIYASRTASDAPNMYIECYITSVGDTRNIGFIITGSDGNYVNMWNLSGNSFVSGGFRGWTAGDNVCTSGEIGGTSDAVISVGSYNSRFTFPMWAKNQDYLYVMDDYGPDVIPEGEVSFFSSCGPTIDGRMKPDVLAPGALVISAMNWQTDFSSYPSEMVARTLDDKGNGHYYYFNLGTSMSSPVVAGGIALWLQAKSDLTPDEIRKTIKSTAVQDDVTGSEPNNQSGYGKFDAYNGLKHILEAAGIDGIEADKAEAPNIWVESGTRIICVASSTHSRISVFNIMGAHVGQYDVASGLGQIDASSWAAGIYILRDESTGVTKKIAIM